MAYGIWPKILLIGKYGQVGWELERCLAPLGQIIALDYPEIDLAKPDTIIKKVRLIKPNLIVNAAAYTAVDQAEEEPDLAMAINGTAPGILAEEAKKLGTFLVHYSTDYVFDGTKTTPYTEEDEPNPLNVYGTTKLAGDRAIQAVDIPHLIFRTSWVYGLRGKNFLLTMLKLAQEKDEIRVIDDQIGSPTWCKMIAESTNLVLAQGYEKVYRDNGLYNLTSDGQTSWFGFADRIIQTIESNCKVSAISTKEYQTATIRPKYSVLSNKRYQTSFRDKLYKWEEYLELVCMNLDQII